MWILKIEDENYNRFRFEINDLNTATNLIKALQDYSKYHLEYNLEFVDVDNATVEETEEGEE